MNDSIQNSLRICTQDTYSFFQPIEKALIYVIKKGTCFLFICDAKTQTGIKMCLLLIDDFIVEAVSNIILLNSECV